MKFSAENFLFLENKQFKTNKIHLHMAAVINNKKKCKIIYFEKYIFMARKFNITTNEYMELSVPRFQRF